MSANIGRARACANIALAKYWGKSDVTYNLPAVPSISLTLDPLFTETSVELSSALKQDELILNGAPALGGELTRASELLDRVRAEAGTTLRARVESKNHFPTASGLASSASGFAALAAAARKAAGLPFDARKTSALARRSSASAARSVFGGFVELPAGVPGDDALAAEPLAPPSHWDVRIVVAVTAEGRKAVGSTDGMTHTKVTSPYYDAWVAASPALAAQVREGIRARDLAKVGPAMEQSTLAMHACALAAGPGVLYFQPATLAAFACVRELRQSGQAQVFATMDAGPHVKALCLAEQVSIVSTALAAVPGVLRTLVAKPGAGVELV
ncbi:MAG TPA: diphosphomevalonate decarboxylase [Polyangiales bacterium]|jgi:diphosphomevalonate decarboxylase|nr:diphosphomevalonate decarboxylase [Polyangiales bacterium]